MNISDADAKQELLDNLTELKALSTKEYTFAQKWDQLFNTIVGGSKAIHWARRDIWTPTDLGDKEGTIAAIERLKPKIIFADEDKHSELWNIYKHFVSSATHHQTPGRFIRFFVVDETQLAKRRLHWVHLQNLVLGVGAVSGDFLQMPPRDEYIGWTKEQRNGGKLKHTAAGSTIIATQPFGYNFLGGKLIAALITSRAIRDEWQLQYGDVLVGMTTTSLFGLPSMYTRITQWKELGETAGAMPIEPKTAIYKKWYQLLDLKQKLSTWYEEGGGNYKLRVLSRMYQAAGIKTTDFQHGHKRGIYFSEFYENTRDFLCDRVTEDELRLRPLFQESVEQITDRWRTKAIERYRTLHAQCRLKPQKHFYEYLDRMDYETAKQIFLDEVGR